MRQNTYDAEFQDEIWECGKEGNINRLLAYWDYELECYIYLQDAEVEATFCSAS